MHAESGYWRPKPDGTIEVVIAQSTGLVEVQVNHRLSFLLSRFTIKFRFIGQKRIVVENRRVYVFRF